MRKRRKRNGRKDRSRKWKRADLLAQMAEMAKKSEKEKQQNAGEKTTPYVLNHHRQPPGMQTPLATTALHFNLGLGLGQGVKEKVKRKKRKAEKKEMRQQQMTPITQYPKVPTIRAQLRPQSQSAQGKGAERRWQLTIQKDANSLPID